VQLLNLLFFSLPLTRAKQWPAGWLPGWLAGIYDKLWPKVKVINQ